MKEKPLWYLQAFNTNQPTSGTEQAGGGSWTDAVVVTRKRKRLSL